VDTVCRYAGDKFALILPEIDPVKARTVQRKISTALTSGFDLGKGSQAFTATFAQVHYPTEGASETDLLRRLLTALEAAKGDSSSANA
jgi:GGDEF domain-containing protein